MKYPSSHSNELSSLFPTLNQNWLENVLSHIKALSKRLPNIHIVYPQLAWLLSQSASTIPILRDKRWLVSITYRLAKLKEEVTKRNKIEPKENHIQVHPFSLLIHYPFQKQWALGIAIAYRAQNLNNRLSDQALEQAVTTLFPSLTLVKGSIYTHRDPNKSVELIYFEVTKSGNEKITIKEKQVLIKTLPSRLECHLRPPLPPLFVSWNEEEILKGILILSDEITRPEDPPQLILRFHQVEKDHLLFIGALVRITDPNTPSIETLKKKLPQKVEWEIEGISAIHPSLNLPKEAISFSLRFEHKTFIRMDGAIDLQKGRQFALHNLQSLFGNIRDYNGGWMAQQKETFEAIKQKIENYTQEDFLLLENLFYSLTPRVTQSYLCPSLLAQVFRLTKGEIEVFKKSPDAYRVIHDQNGLKEVVIVIATENSCLEAIENLLNDHLHLVSACFSYKGLVIAVMIHLHPEVGKIDPALNAIRHKLKSWEKKHSPNQILRLSMQKVTFSLDPRLRSDRRSGPLMNLLYEGLMRIDSNGNPILAVAENIEVSPDRHHYCFHLGKSYWSNGETVTAYDFEYSWKKVLDPLFSSPFASMIYCIKGAKEAKEGKISVDEIGIKARNASTLLVELETPTPHFLSCVANWTLLPLRKDIDLLSPEWACGDLKKFLCNGPFMPQNIEEGAIQLVRNPYYHGCCSIHIDKIEIFQGQSTKENIEMWKKEKLDWIGDPLCPIPSTYSNQEIALSKATSLAVCALYLNTQIAPFIDRQARQMVARLFQKHPLSLKMLPLEAVPTQHYVSPTMGLDTEIPSFPDNIVQLPSVLRLAYPQCDDLEKVCQEIATHLYNHFNIKVIIESVSWEAFFRGGLKETQLGVFIAYPWCEGPISSLDRFRFSEPQFNPLKWECKTYTELLKKADYAIGEQEQFYYLKKAEECLLMEAPLIPLYFHPHQYAQQNWIKGSIINSLGMLDLSKLYINKK